MAEAKEFIYVNSLTCLGLAPPRRTSKRVAHKWSDNGNLNSLSDIAEKIGCIIEFSPFLKFSEIDLERPTEKLKNFAPFFSEGRSTKSLPRNCKPSNLIGSNSLSWQSETNIKMCQIEQNETATYITV